MINSWLSVCPLIICLVLGSEAEALNFGSFQSTDEVDIEEFPWQATLIDSIDDEHPCGAAIISKRHLITSALCTYLNSVDTLRINVGSSIFEEGIWYNLKSIHTHPNFTSDFPFPHNIAVIELDGEIEFDDTKSPIALPDENVPLGATVTVTGWGNGPWGTFSKHLKKQDLTITESSMCDIIIENINEIDIYGPLHSSQVCGVPTPNTPLCQGDEGTAVVYEKTLVGVNSWRVSCQDENPEIITRVDEHVDWIRSVINN